MTQAFNLSQFANNVNSSGKADLTTAVTGTLPVGNGGTGSTGLTQYGVVIGGGSSALSTVSTTSPTTAAAGDLLVYQGAGLTPIWKTPVTGTTIEYITTTTLWTVPAGVTKALVWVFGGAGAGYLSGLLAYKGGFGGYIAGYVTGLSGTVSITVGAGGTAAGSGSVGTAGGTTTFGSPALLTATGGTASSGSGTATNGTGTLGAGVTRIRSLCGLEGAQSTPTTTQSTDIALTGNAQTITPATTVFVQSGLTSGQGNTIWATNYLEAPGTSFQNLTQSLRNGMGGAVIIQY